jgi:hypothetical protein
MKLVFPVLAAALTALPLWAQENVGPRLGAASSFGQTWDRRMLDAADRFGIHDLRDELYWKDIETGGEIAYPTIRHSYPALLAARGMTMTVIMNNGHPAFQGGVTPYTAEGVEAFARFSARMPQDFPAITSVEVGNEMNSDTFTSGPMRAADLAGRAEIYATLIEATYKAVKAADPQVRVLGGAAHSIPIAWFRALSEAGAAEWMDAVVIHPYTTPPEQLPRQIALLRQVPGFGALPIEATEFGDPNGATAAATLAKYYCAMAVSGVTRAVWYPLNTRGDGLEPLVGTDYDLTDVGAAFTMLQARAEGVPVRDVSPDPFTYACAFGSDLIVIWGAPRDIEVDAELTLLGPDGRETDRRTLSRDVPLIVSGDGVAVSPGENLRLGPQTVIADSYDQFDHDGAGDGFRPFVRFMDGDAPFAFRPGQETGGVPWVPYLASARDGGIRMNAEFIVPTVTGAVGHRYVAEADGAVVLDISLAPDATSDGVVLSVLVNDAELARQVVTGGIDTRIGPFDMATGDALEILVASGASDAGDASSYRFTLSRAP